MGPDGNGRQTTEPTVVVTGRARLLRASCPSAVLVLVSEIEAALEALAERGWWVRDAGADGDLLRVELRRAARRRGIRLRTGISDAGVLWAATPDGLPAEEPWRGAAEHAHESGVIGDLVADAIDRAFREDRGEG